jgi:hypothetical protein
MFVSLPHNAPGELRPTGENARWGIRPMYHLGINLLIRDCKASLSSFLPLPHHHLDLQRLIVHGLPQC